MSQTVLFNNLKMFYSQVNSSIVPVSLRKLDKILIFPTG